MRFTRLDCQYWRRCECVCVFSQFCNKVNPQYLHKAYLIDYQTSFFGRARSAYPTNYSKINQIESHKFHQRMGSLRCTPFIECACINSMNNGIFINILCEIVNRTTTTAHKHELNRTELNCNNITIKQQHSKDNKFSLHMR